MNALFRWDTALFRFINGLPHSPFLDGVAATLSGIGEGGFVWIIAGLYLIIREEKRDHGFLFPITSVGILGYILSDTLKNFFGRMRPDSLSQTIVVGSIPSGYSFPSTHTTLSFAYAFLLSYKEPALRIWFFILAALIGFSRIYLGHHFPFDVFAGVMLGFAIGWGIWAIYNRKHDQTKRTGTPHGPRRSGRGKTY